MQTIPLQGVCPVLRNVEELHATQGAFAALRADGPLALGLAVGRCARVLSILKAPRSCEVCMWALKGLPRHVIALGYVVV